MITYKTKHISEYNYYFSHAVLNHLVQFYIENIFKYLPQKYLILSPISNCRVYKGLEITPTGNRNFISNTDKEQQWWYTFSFVVFTVELQLKIAIEKELDNNKKLGKIRSHSIQITCLVLNVFVFLRVTYRSTDRTEKPVEKHKLWLILSKGMKEI